MDVIKDGLPSRVCVASVKFFSLPRRRESVFFGSDAKLFQSVFRKTKISKKNKSVPFTFRSFSGVGKRFIFLLLEEDGNRPFYAPQETELKVI